jgi:hypothetical protein
MNVSGDKSGEIRPDLVRRTCGGWLAVAPNGAKFAIGVTAPTQEQSLEKFRSVYNRWVEILEIEPK